LLENKELVIVLVEFSLPRKILLGQVTLDFLAGFGFPITGDWVASRIQSSLISLALLTRIPVSGFHPSSRHVVRISRLHSTAPVKPSNAVIWLAEMVIGTENRLNTLAAEGEFGCDLGADEIVDLVRYCFSFWILHYLEHLL
jgi:hypothetical protein